jgi:urea carboxylase-associated protein 2
MSLRERFVLWEETIEAGATWSHVLKRGTSLRITDMQGGCNVGALFYNFDCPLERYDMPDTLKAQHATYLTKGFVLYSDMGRILCSIIDDSVGWHDPLGGFSDAALVREKYGEARFQDCGNQFYRNTQDGFLMELAKWGLGPRDLTANVNLFSRVEVSEEGNMLFHPGNSMPRSAVELRAEMNVLTILNTCQHPLDPNPKYEPKGVRISIRKGAVSKADDPIRALHPQNARGFILTERYFL